MLKDRSFADVGKNEGNFKIAVDPRGSLHMAVSLEPRHFSEFYTFLKKARRLFNSCTHLNQNAGIFDFVQ